MFAPKAAPGIEGRGPLIMRCQPPERVPVLSTLALEFAVCTRWFCSVPGETWPNRNFVHSATSDGTTIIVTRWYENQTIFELLEKAGKTWRIYYDDTPQVWAFKHLWDTPDQASHWFRFADFATACAAGDLPNYTFIEPNHRPPVHMAQPDQSNSQHPGNNMVTNDQYDSYPADPDGDFKRGEGLIANVYESLRANPALFEHTVLVITYDEHGGFYDHVPPPVGIPPPGVANDPGVIGKLMDIFFRTQVGVVRLHDARPPGARARHFPLYPARDGGCHHQGSCQRARHPPGPVRASYGPPHRSRRLVAAVPQPVDP